MQVFLLRKTSSVYKEDTKSIIRFEGCNRIIEFIRMSLFASASTPVQYELTDRESQIGYTCVFYPIDTSSFIPAGADMM